MPYKDKIITKLYYTIGEVALSLGVATSLIRFWEGEFKQIKPNRNRKGTRKYTQKDVETIELIYFLVKELKFKLAGARQAIKEGWAELIIKSILTHRKEKKLQDEHNEKISKPIQNRSKR